MNKLKESKTKSFGAGINYLSKARGKDLRGVVLLRLDFNSEDEWRMKAAVPTIKFLLKRADKILILSHRGRPQPISHSLIRANGGIRGVNKKLSLRKDAIYLSKLLGKKVVFLPRFNFEKIKDAVRRAPKNSVFVLENVRFLKGEEANDGKLARKLAALGDFYVNDAFAVSHRKNASVVAITEFLPSFTGLEMEKEIKFLSHAMTKSGRPLVVVLGGAKAHDKLGVLKYFRNKADSFLLGGAAANTLLFLKGVDVKNSLMDKDKKDLKNLRKILGYKNLVLPVDLKFGGRAALDIGKATAEIFSEKIRGAKTIIWSGPMGAFEKKGFSAGTLAVARAITSNKKTFSLTGGGETVAFLKERGLDKKFSFISTGGGAMLDFLAGEKLPGIAALGKAPASTRRRWGESLTKGGKH